MDNLLYTASAGTREIMLTQAVLTNNLANAGTVGFRKDLQHTQSNYLSGNGLNTRVFAGNRTHGFDTAEGRIQPTGHSLDIAINGEGWFVVLSEDGTEALSRRGDLRLGMLGQLVDGAGNPIMGEGGPIVLPPHSDIAIGTDGTVSIVPLGDDINEMATVERIKLANPDKLTLHKGADGLIHRQDNVPFEPSAEVRVISGSLEASNVNPIEVMVQMIELSRRLEGHVKLMGTIEEMDQSSSQLMRVN